MKRTIISLLLTLVLLGSVSAAIPLAPTPLDMLVTHPYNKQLDFAGTLLTGASLATAGILLGEESNEYTTIGVMFLETMATTWLTKELLKNTFQRERPYTNDKNFPLDGKENKSFPSGHTALAFAGASFTSYVFASYHQDSPWRIPVALGSFSLALGTAILRLESGSHYPTDVLLGAALGSAIGFAIPFLHHRNQDQNTEAIVSPFAFIIKKTY